MHRGMPSDLFDGWCTDLTSSSPGLGHHRHAVQGQSICSGQDIIRIPLLDNTGPVSTFQGYRENQRMSLGSATSGESVYPRGCHEVETLDHEVRQVCIHICGASLHFEDRNYLTFTNYTFPQNMLINEYIFICL